MLYSYEGVTILCFILMRGHHFMLYSYEGVTILCFTCSKVPLASVRTGNEL